MIDKKFIREVNSSIIEPLEKEIEYLKKVYNDLAESHAKQVIEIGELMKEVHEYKLLSEHFKAANQVEILESELLKAKELLRQIGDTTPSMMVKADIEEFLNKK